MGVGKANKARDTNIVVMLASIDHNPGGTLYEANKEILRLMRRAYSPHPAGGA